jgi:mono/diheme cytochrome c family protein
MRVVSWPAAALAFAVMLSALGALAQAPAFSPREEQAEDLPPGRGRDETFGLCTACHNFRLVSAQGMTRERWDETMTWMTARHNMPDVQGEDRDLVLNYLSTHYPPRAPSGPAGGFRNPFAAPQ